MILRDKAYAHTDREFRGVIVEPTPEGGVRVGEGWFGLLRERLPVITQLTTAQAARFGGEVQVRLERLGESS